MKKPRIEGYYKYSEEKAVASKLLLSVLKEKYLSVLDVGCGDGTLSGLLYERTENLHLCEINPFYESKLRSRFPRSHIEINDIWNVNLKKYDLIHFSQGLYYHEAEKWIPLIDYLMGSLADDGELILVMNCDQGSWWNAVSSVWTTHSRSLKFFYKPLSNLLRELQDKYQLHEYPFSYNVRFPDSESRDTFIKDACVSLREGESQAKLLLDQYISQLSKDFLSFDYQSNLVKIRRK